MGQLWNVFCDGEDPVVAEGVVEEGAEEDGEGVGGDDRKVGCRDEEVHEGDHDDHEGPVGYAANGDVLVQTGARDIARLHRDASGWHELSHFAIPVNSYWRYSFEQIVANGTLILGTFQTIQKRRQFKQPCAVL